MRLVLNRDVFGDDFTLGQLSLDGERLCYTCEDKVRPEKIYGKTAIPFGAYKVQLTWSNRFQKVLPLLLNVPGFEGIRIHSGNTAADTDGCILVGLERTVNSVLCSRDAMAMLMPLLKDADSKDQDITMEIA